MKRSKKIFILVSLLFFLAVVLVTVDISRKTTFPGSKKYLKESVMPTDNETAEQDSTKEDLRSEEKN